MKDRYQKRYGEWVGNPRGDAPNYARCATEVFSNSTMALPMQCHRPNGHGPDGAYCKVHAKRFLHTV